MSKILYTTTRETVVERTPIPRAPRQPIPFGEPLRRKPMEGYNENGANALEMLCTGGTGLEQWPEGDGTVLTVARTSPEAAEVLRTVAKLVQA